MKLDTVIYFIFFLLPIAFAAVLDQSFGIDEPVQEVQLVESSQEYQFVPLIEQTESTEVSETEESAKENEKDQCPNQFAKFHDLEFIKENILDYLPIKEQFMFMCTRLITTVSLKFCMIRPSNHFLAVKPLITTQVMP